MPDVILPATVIGSWSFPGWFEKFADDVKHHPEQFGPADRDEAVRDAIRLAIDDQLRAGLDRITDGEMQRVDFNLGFYQYIRGIEPIPQARRWGEPPMTNVTGTEPSARCPHQTGWVLSRSIAGSANIPLLRSRFRSRPFTLSGCIDCGDVYLAHGCDHGARADRQWRAAGARRRRGRFHSARRTQLRLPSGGARVLPRNPGHDSRRCQRLYQHASLFWKLSRPAVGHRSYAPLLPHLARARVNQLALEFASREMAEIELLAGLPESMDVAVGLVDVKNTWIEPPELIADRLWKVFPHVDARRVSVTPDCGFSQTARHVAIAKARAMVEGVNLVRKEFGQ